MALSAVGFTSVPVVLSNAVSDEIISGGVNRPDVVDIFVVNVFSVSDLTVSLVPNCNSSVVSMILIVDNIVAISIVEIAA